MQMYKEMYSNKKYYDKDKQRLIAAQLADKNKKINVKLHKPAILHIHADIDSTDFGVRELKNGNVGHSWVSLQWKDKEPIGENIIKKYPSHATYLTSRKGMLSDPMGFWPYMFSSYDPFLDQWMAALDRVGYSTNLFSSYVKGQVVHPDTLHSPKATSSYDVTEEEAIKVIDYAKSKENARYSVYWYNCTTFAKEAVEAAGKSAPSSTYMGFAYPNALYDSIVKMSKSRVESDNKLSKETKNE